jgi:hypothetical protein
MRHTAYLTSAILGLALTATPALAGMCQAGKLMCPTKMPVGGYCECTAHGVTTSGTVVAKAPPKQKVDATAGGCGAQPHAPGCP